MAYIGQSISEGIRRAHTYTASAGQTTLVLYTLAHHL